MKLYQRIEAIGKSHLSSRARLVLCMMANFAWDNEDLPVYPGVARLAGMTGYCANSVSKTLEEIEAAGLAKRLRGHGFKSGMRTATEYVIDWEAVAAAAEPKSKRGAANLPRRENSQGLGIQSSQSLEVQNPQGLEVQISRDWETVHTPEQQPGSDPVGAPAPEPAQPVPDDRPSHLAFSPVGATADGRPGDGEGFPFAHAPTPPAALRGSDASDGGGEPAKGRKRRDPSAVTPDELDAFGRILAAWDAIGGKRQRLDPEAGVGASVLARIRDIGEQAMCDRIAGLRLDPSGYWPAALEGRGLDARGNPRPALTIEAVARVGKPGDWLSERQAAGAQARLEAQDKAPRDWRPTLEAWSTAERHPGLDHKADWIRALAAACALGARGDWAAVCAWLRDPAHREAVATALGAPPVEQDAPAGADAWADMLPRMKSPSRMLAPWQPRGPRLAADDAEHERRATAWRGGLWVRWCGASDDAERREIAGLWRATYAEAVTA